MLGDSLSAGIGSTVRCWPRVLGETTSLRVVNLAQPGARVEDAIRQAQGIVGSNAVVIVEIGGNDLLAFGEDAEKFAVQLDRLVALLRANRHQVLLMELPLFSFQNRYGRAQRAIAAQYHVALLPKRYLTQVLGIRQGTIDGLHLSQAGHGALAHIMADVMVPE